jgi:zinc transport system substrate-binding protein
MKHLCVSFCLLFVFTGCKPPADQSQAQSGKIQVAATINPLRDIVANIGGERVSVISIMPPGSSPHTFEVRPETIDTVRGSKVLFMISEGLDNWADRITSSVDQIELAPVAKDIPLRKFDDGSTDPHYWLAASNAKIIAKNVAEKLARLDPNSDDFYNQNLSAYLQKLDSLDTEIKQKLAALPNKNIVTFHEAWFYFAAAYGLDIVAAFEPFPGKEPTPAFLAEFTKTIKDNNIKVIFSEPQFSPDAIRQLAQDLGVKLETIDPEGGTTKETSTYIGLMQYNADKIYQALK